VVNLKIVAIVVDNGEPTLKECLESLLSQTVKPKIIVAGGSKTDYQLAKQYADDILGPIDSPGRARVAGVLKADSEYIISADSDTIYDTHYVEEAVKSLEAFKAVKAMWVEPLQPSPLASLELLFVCLLPYEFTLAFRRSAFLEAGIHLEDYPDRLDIGKHFTSIGKLPAIPNPLMKVKTRMPTKGFQEFLAYTPSLLLGMTPVAVAGGIAIWSLLK
jgi:glycosyltransferase involved in cell wall biosynthesis